MSQVIQVENITKSFKRFVGKKHHTTLKDALLSSLRPRRDKAIPNFQALKGINFSVDKGTVLGIIGPNGAGKSTLFKVLAGIYRPDSGKIHIKGRVSALLNLEVGFHPELTGRENIMIAGLALGISRKNIKESFDEIIDYAELQEFIDAPVRTYSAGMHVRLGFSIAVKVNPDILLLDEVLAVGDERFQKKSRKSLDNFKDQGKTLLLVTHNLDVAANWCHQVMWLEKGAIVDIGDPREVVASYRKQAGDNG